MSKDIRYWLIPCEGVTIEERLRLEAKLKEKIEAEEVSRRFWCSRSLAQMKGAFALLFSLEKIKKEQGNV